MKIKKYRYFLKPRSQNEEEDLAVHLQRRLVMTKHQTKRKNIVVKVSKSGNIKIKNKNKNGKNGSSRNRNRQVVGSSMSFLGGKFAKALRNPFSPETLGVRVPDPFCFPTSTYHMHATIVHSQLAGGNGYGTVLFLPHPMVSVIDVGAYGSSTWGSISGSVGTPLTTFTSNTQVHGMTDLTGLTSLLADYRVASWGIKISCLVPELTATGRVICAPVYIGDTVPSYASLNSNTYDINLLADITGQSASTFTSSAMLNLPGAFEVTMQDLLHGDLELVGSYADPGFFRLKSVGYNSRVAGATTVGNAPVSITGTAGTGSTNTYEGDVIDMTTTSGGSWTAFVADVKDRTRMVGGVAWAVWSEGIPVPASGTSPYLQYEVIYHIEGQPRLAGAGTVPVPSIGASSYAGSVIAVEEGCAATRGGAAVKWLARGASFLNETSKQYTGKSIAQHAMNVVRSHPLARGLGF